MAADVFLWRLPAVPGAELAPADPRPGLRALVAAVEDGRQHGAAGSCAVKVHLGPPGRPADIAPGWAREVAQALLGGGAAVAGGAVFATDSLSFSTRGLDTAESLREVARAKGYAPPGAAGGLAFVVADDPDGAAGLPLGSPGADVAAPPADGSGANAEVPTLAGALAAAARVALLVPVRPHPHLGLVGAVATLGLELVTHETRLALHRGIRPQVDTPLCAGCGSCLDVCLWDAIVFRGGRATIDHQRCTGCGECMSVCFMAGISAAESAGLAGFQVAVARSAAAVARHLARPGAGPPIYLNSLVQIAPVSSAARGRRPSVAGIGLLASRDPVALDAAAFDRLYERLGGRPSALGGYPQEPDALLAAAEAQGLGSRSYRLREVGAQTEFLD